MPLSFDFSSLSKNNIDRDAIVAVAIEMTVIPPMIQRCPGAPLAYSRYQRATVGTRRGSQIAANLLKELLMRSIGDHWSRYCAIELPARFHSLGTDK